jgi:hypothetical protein
MDSYLDGQILYKKGFDATLLRSLNDRKAKKGNRRSTWRCLSYIYYWAYEEHILLNNHKERLHLLYQEVS